MRVIKSLFDFYIFSDLHVSISCAALGVISFHNLHVPVQFKYVIVIFLSTLLAYQFIRIADNFFSPIMSTPFPFNRYILLKYLFVIALFLVLILLLNSFNKNEIWLLIPITIFTLTYAVPFVKIKNKKYSLRYVPAIKIFVIALVWSLFTVGFPNLNQWNELNFWVEIVQRFSFIIAITIPFDIRDYKTDSGKLITLPQKIGVKYAKGLALFLMLIFLFLGLLKTPFNINQFSIEFCVFLLTIFLVTQIREEKSIYFTAFWIESIPIFWLILIYIVEVQFY